MVLKASNTQVIHCDYANVSTGGSDAVGLGVDRNPRVFLGRIAEVSQKGGKELHQGVSLGPSNETYEDLAAK